MSDYYLPFEIQIEIIKKLPVKPLIQLRSVSKSWKSLIDSSEFIANYHFNTDQPQHRVLVRYVEPKHSSSINPTTGVNYEPKVEKYVSIVDDDSFPQHKFPLIVPSNIRQLLDRNPSILGSSQGVLCLCVDFCEFTYWHYTEDEEKTFVLWNPTIKKSVPVVVPGHDDDMEFISVFGFGVCPRTSVPKLVKISYISSSRVRLIENLSPQVEIFSLSSGSWRRSLSMNVPRKSIELLQRHVCVDKCIYWYAFDRTVTGETKQKNNLILSFDMTTEEFIEIDLCDGLKEGKRYLGDEGYLSLSKSGTSLVVLQPKDGWYKEISVWRMDHGVPNSFTKLFVIKSPIESLQINEVHGFRKTGEPIIKTNKLVVYEPNSGEISDIEIACFDYSSIAISYIETLLLLDS